MPAGQHEIRSHGITCLLASHPRIRRLKRAHPPTIHGTRQWPSSWLLIDYLARHPIPPGSRVVEIGAGWGLTGIYCAKRFGANVLAVDKDPAVFPYLALHAERNGVTVGTLCADFAGLGRSVLAGADILVGSDVCFWTTMIPELKSLVLRALRAGVSSVLVADPARHTFESLAKDLCARGVAQVTDWRTERPLPRSGRILRASRSLS